MIMDPIEHENSIKLWEIRTNGIKKVAQRIKSQRSKRDHIVKDEIQLTKDRSRKLSKQLKELASV